MKKYTILAISIFLFLSMTMTAMQPLHDMHHVNGHRIVLYQGTVSTVPLANGTHWLSYSPEATSHIIHQEFNSVRNSPDGGFAYIRYLIASGYITPHQMLEPVPQQQYTQTFNDYNRSSSHSASELDSPRTSPARSTSPRNPNIDPKEDPIFHGILPKINPHGVIQRPNN